MVKGQGSTLGPIREVYGGSLTPKEQAPKGASSTPLSELRCEYSLRGTILQGRRSRLSFRLEKLAALRTVTRVRGGYAGGLADMKPGVSTDAYVWQAGAESWLPGSNECRRQRQHLNNVFHTGRAMKG